MIVKLIYFSDEIDLNDSNNIPESIPLNDLILVQSYNDTAYLVKTTYDFLLCELSHGEMIVLRIQSSYKQVVGASVSSIHSALLARFLI